MSIYERRKKKSQIKWDESPITDLCSNYLKSLTFTDENKKSWKTDESSTSKNNSTLSFYICAYTNSDEALSDSRNKNFQKSLLIQKQKQINPFSKFDLQNPYKCEFSDSLNDSIEGLIKKQNQTNPASTFVCQVKYKTKFASRKRPRQQHSAELELDDFINVSIPNDSPDFNLLKWWKENSSRFPRLAVLAKKYHSIPATSAAVERLFSVLNMLTPDERLSLTPEALQNMITFRAIFTCFP